MKTPAILEQTTPKLCRFKSEVQGMVMILLASFIKVIDSSAIDSSAREFCQMEKRPSKDHSRPTVGNSHNISSRSDAHQPLTSLLRDSKIDSSRGSSRSWRTPKPSASSMPATEIIFLRSQPLEWFVVAFESS